MGKVVMIVLNSKTHNVKCRTIEIFLERNCYGVSEILSISDTVCCDFLLLIIWPISFTLALFSWLHVTYFAITRWHQQGCWCGNVLRKKPHHDRQQSPYVKLMECSGNFHGRLVFDRTNRFPVHMVTFLAIIILTWFNLIRFLIWDLCLDYHC